MKKIIICIFTVLGCLTVLQAQTAKKPVSINTAFARGKAVYTQNCMVCHQSDGGGVMGLNPPLIKTTYVLGDQKRLINILLKGMNQEIEIDGEIYANPMPAVSHLTDQQIADVLSYVRNNFGNKASVITAAQVKAVRSSK